ncbi:MAG: hypothetical protein K6A63_07830 [Acholeplasmatales bacterium]|nr:hypothetical protein [Acholeplasmatales bacterium]
MGGFRGGHDSGSSSGGFRGGASSSPPSTNNVSHSSSGSSRGVSVRRHKSEKSSCSNNVTPTPDGCVIVGVLIILFGIVFFILALTSGVDEAILCLIPVIIGIILIILGIVTSKEENKKKNKREVI